MFSKVRAFRKQALTNSLGLIRCFYDVLKSIFAVSSYCRQLFLAVLMVSLAEPNINNLGKNTMHMRHCVQPDW